MNGQDTAALVERLRKEAQNLREARERTHSKEPITMSHRSALLLAEDFDNAVSALESQAAQIEKLRAAVEPFAKAADLYNDCEQHPNGCPDDAQAGELFGVFVGDFRRARQALGDTK